MALQPDPAYEMSPEHIPVSSFGYGDPHYPLFASISKAIRQALTEVNKLGKKTCITTSISEVPQRMKEVMKAQLPVFNEMFKMIIKRCNLLKGIIKLNIGVDRGNWSRCCVNSPYINPIDGVHGGTRNPVTQDGKTHRTWYIALLDRIIAECEAMCKASSNVLSS